MKENKQILIPLANGCEELEAVTLIDLLRRANLQVTTASLTEDTVVECSRGTKLVADKTLQSIVDELGRPFDLIALPGGLPGADNLNADSRIHKLLVEAKKDSRYIAAICAAPRVFVDNPEINIKTMTAYPGALDAFDTTNIQVTSDDVVRDGYIITSKGPGTAIKFSLALIEILSGTAIRQEVESSLCG